MSMSAGERGLPMNASPKESPPLAMRIAALQHAQSGHSREKTPPGGMPLVMPMQVEEKGGMAATRRSQAQFQYGLKLDWPDSESWAQWPATQEFRDEDEKENASKPQSDRSDRASWQQSSPRQGPSDQSYVSETSSVSVNQKINHFLATVSKLAPPEGASKQEADELDQIRNLVNTVFGETDEESPHETASKIWQAAKNRGLSMELIADTFQSLSSSSSSSLEESESSGSWSGQSYTQHLKVLSSYDDTNQLQAASTSTEEASPVGVNLIQSASTISANTSRNTNRLDGQVKSDFPRHRMDPTYPHFGKQVGRLGIVERVDVFQPPGFQQSQFPESEQSPRGTDVAISSPQRARKPSRRVTFSDVLGEEEQNRLPRSESSYSKETADIERLLCLLDPMVKAEEERRLTAEDTKAALMSQSKQDSGLNWQKSEEQCSEAAECTEVAQMDQNSQLFQPKTEAVAENNEKVGHTKAPVKGPSGQDPSLFQQFSISSDGSIGEILKGEAFAEFDADEDALDVTLTRLHEEAMQSTFSHEHYQKETSLKSKKEQKGYCSVPKADSSNSSLHDEAMQSTFSREQDQKETSLKSKKEPKGYCSVPKADSSNARPNSSQRNVNDIRTAASLPPKPQALAKASTMSATRSPSVARSRRMSSRKMSQQASAVDVFDCIRDTTKQDSRPAVFHPPKPQFSDKPPSSPASPSFLLLAPGATKTSSPKESEIGSAADSIDALLSGEQSKSGDEQFDNCISQVNASEEARAKTWSGQQEPDRSDPVRTYWQMFSNVKSLGSFDSISVVNDSNGVTPGPLYDDTGHVMSRLTKGYEMTYFDEDVDFDDDRGHVRPRLTKGYESAYVDSGSEPDPIFVAMDRGLEPDPMLYTMDPLLSEDSEDQFSRASVDTKEKSNKRGSRRCTAEPLDNVDSAEDTIEEDNPSEKEKVVENDDNKERSNGCSIICGDNEWSFALPGFCG